MGSNACCLQSLAIVRRLRLNADWGMIGIEAYGSRVLGLPAQAGDCWATSNRWEKFHANPAGSTPYGR
jgi:hypothetical protein